MNDNQQPPLPPREKWKANAAALMAKVQEHGKVAIDRMEDLTHFGPFGAHATFPMIDEWAKDNPHAAKIVLRAALGIALCARLVDKWEQLDADAKRDQEAKHGHN